MDDIAKTEMRNYAMSAGFLAIAMLMLPNVIEFIFGNIVPAMIDTFTFISAVLLLLTGVVLIILKNRDLTAITFLMLGMITTTFDIAAFTLPPDKASIPIMGLISGIFMLILALIILTAKDKKKYLLFILPALFGLRFILGFYSQSFIFIIGLIIAVISIYFAFACASEKIKLPLGSLLTADVVTDFKSSGSVLGYLLISLSSAAWASHYFLGESIVSLLGANIIDIGCGFMLIFGGVLLFAVGKMRFTPVMFIVAGFLVMLGGFVTGALMYPIGIIMIILGLFAVLRKESRILPAIMLIIYGVTYLISANAGLASLPMVSAILNLVVSLIAIYLAFAVFSQRKLPLF